MTGAGGTGVSHLRDQGGGRCLRSGRDRGLDRAAGEVALDVGAHRGRGLVAVLEALGQRLHHDRVDLRRQVGVVLRRRRHRLAHVLVGDGDRAVADERRASGEQLVEQAAGGVDVGSRVDGLATRLLGGEVLRGADHGCRLGHRRLGVADRTGDAEVHHLHVTGGGEHHVAGLDVAVDDPRAVAVVERGQHAAADLQGPLGQDLATLAEYVAQGAAGDVLHHDVGLGDTGAVGGGFLAGVVDGHDRRVVQGGRGLRLTTEPGLEGGVAGEVGAETLDRDHPAEPGVGALAHLGHATAAQQLAELVAATDHGRLRVAHRALFLNSMFMGSHSSAR